jgi:hypothetical protein
MEEGGERQRRGGMLFFPQNKKAQDLLNTVERN